MKNCRNCAWANWQAASNGRRLFGNYASCAYPIFVILPASRPEVSRMLERIVGVREYSDVPVECDAWKAKQ